MEHLFAGFDESGAFAAPSDVTQEP
jgi:hypothetical protein